MPLTNGNDIKIEGTQNLFIQVLDPTDTFVVPTLTQVFSITGTGDVTAFVQANDQFGNPEAIQSFHLTDLFRCAGPGTGRVHLHGHQRRGRERAAHPRCRRHPHRLRALPDRPWLSRSWQPIVGSGHPRPDRCVRRSARAELLAPPPQWCAASVAR